MSQKLMTDFPQIDLWETRNEPNLHINTWITGNGTEVTWHGFFGFNINNNGDQVKVLPATFNESDYSVIGAKEYAEYQKAFYQGKINARSQIPIAYAGSMWAHVGTSPMNINKLDHNFDRWVLKYLKDVCPENGCFDVMNLHYYNPGDMADIDHYFRVKKGSNPNEIPDNPIFNEIINDSRRYGYEENFNKRYCFKNPRTSQAAPSSASREDFFHCHDPYASAILKGKIRRIKYDMMDILGVAKPFFSSEIGYAWNHDRNNPNYINDVRGAQGGWIKQLTEARAEGVDGIIEYEVGGTHNPHEGLLVDTYPVGTNYDPSKPEGPVFHTFAKMVEFLKQYNFVKYGGLNPVSRDESSVDRKDVFSYVFKNKDFANNPNLYMEVIWNKLNDGNATTQVTIPRRSNGDLGTITLYKINHQNPQGLDVINVDPNSRTFELKGTEPVIVTYLADNSEGAPSGRVDSPSSLSPANGWVNISGWTLSPNKAIDRVELHIDGVKRDELPYGLVKDEVCRGADGHSKPDFQFSQCPFVGFGGNLNMEIYRLSQGDHKIEVIAFDALGNRTVLNWGETNQNFGTLRFATSNRVPFGHFDTVDPSCTLYGWAADADISVPLNIDVYVGGPAGTGQWVAAGRADRPRNPGEVIPDNSRFAIPLQASLKDNREHDVYVYALDPSPNSPNTLLPGSPKRVKCSASGGGLVSPTPGSSPDPGTGIVGVIIQYFGQPGDQNIGDQNNDRKVNELDFGAVYAR